MKDRLGVGFVGAGFMSTFHAQAWKSVRHADIMGVVGKRKSRAKAFANLCRETRVGNPKVFNTVTEMALDPAIDVIYIVSPNYTRVPVMQEIVKARGRNKEGLVSYAV